MHMNKNSENLDKDINNEIILNNIFKILQIIIQILINIKGMIINLLEMINNHFN